MKTYLVKTFDENGEEIESEIVSLARVFVFIDAAKYNGTKIAIYEIGECVIDWS